MDEQQLVMMILITAVVLAVVLVLRRSQRLAVRRLMSATIGVIAGLAGYLAIIGYAVPALSDLNSPRVGLWTAVLENLLIWAVCLTSLGLAVRFVLYAFRPPGVRANGSAKPASNA